MDAEIIKTVSQTAGIGGVALGIYLLLFRDIIRKQIFPELSRQHAFRLLRLIALLVWSVAVLGMGAWVWTVTPPIKGPIDEILGFDLKEHPQNQKVDGSSNEIVIHKKDNNKEYTSPDQRKP
jgi:hypothetical protein